MEELEPDSRQERNYLNEGVNSFFSYFVKPFVVSDSVNTYVREPTRESVQEQLEFQRGRAEHNYCHDSPWRNFPTESQVRRRVFDSKKGMNGNYSLLTRIAHFFM